MNRTLIAAAFAAAMLPATALHAAAAPLDTINRTYALTCTANQTDGVSLKSGMMIIRNTTPHTIRQGTQITIKTRVAFGRWERTQVETAFRDVPAGETIAFAPRFRIVSCTATVTLQPNLKSKLDKIVR